MRLVAETIHVGWPKKTWQNTVSTKIHIWKVDLRGTYMAKENGGLRMSGKPL